jgi:Trk-type K+ transport system membrane component
VERQNVRFIDALFTCVSAVCCVGLTTLDLSTLTIASQVVLWVLVQVGCIVLTSTVPVLIRRHYFAKTMKEALRSLGMNEKECDRLLRQELEYRALGWVLTIAFVHMLFWPLLMAIVWGLYFTNNDSARAPLDAGNVNPWWWSFFMATAATHNAGFSLLADNLVQFASNTFFLLSASLLILVGNIGYPLVMYGNVYLLHRIYGAKEPAFAFLLARPRKCFTHLFNRASTLILLGVMVFTTFFEFFLFLALDYNEAYIQSFPPPVRALVGWFQAISTRCAGFNSIDIGQTAPAMQLVYAVMMYLTVYPFALTIRRSADMDAAAEAAGLPALLAHPEPSGASAASSEAGNGTTPAGTASSGQQLSQQAVARELEATQAAELARLAQAISIAQRASGLGSGGSVALRTVGPGSLSNVTFADTGSFRLRSGGSFRKGITTAGLGSAPLTRGDGSSGPGSSGPGSARRLALPGSSLGSAMGPGAGVEDPSAARYGSVSASGSVISGFSEPMNGVGGSRIAGSSLFSADSGRPDSARPAPVRSYLSSLADARSGASQSGVAEASASATAGAGPAVAAIEAEAGAAASAEDAARVAAAPRAQGATGPRSPAKPVDPAARAGAGGCDQAAVASATKALVPTRSAPAVPPWRVAAEYLDHDIGDIGVHHSGHRHGASTARRAKPRLSVRPESKLRAAAAAHGPSAGHAAAGYAHASARLHAGVHAVAHAHAEEQLRAGGHDAARSAAAHASGTGTAHGDEAATSGEATGRPTGDAAVHSIRGVPADDRITHAEASGLRRRRRDSAEADGAGGADVLPPAGGTKGDAADAADEVASVAESSILYDEFGHPLPPPPPVQTLRKEASGMFSRELFWLFTMLLAITISETNSIRDNAHPTYFNIFTVLFELSSAFGGVGLSIGYPGSPLSLSGQFNTFSKLVLIVAILAGRQRGLPTSIDPAVYLPALLSTKEAAEATSTAPDAAAAVQSLVQMSVQMFDAGRRRPMASIRSIFGPQAVASGKQTPTAGATDGAGTRATLFPRVGGGTTPRLAEPKLAGAASPRLRPQMHVTAPFTAVVVSVPGGGATPSHGNAPEPTGGAAGTVDADAAGASSISAQGVNSAAHGPSADATDMPELSLDS